MRASLFVFVLLASLAGCSKPMASQRPDLSFWFRCEQRATPELEKKIESFLLSKGFRVLNLGALQREANVAVFDLNIVALDAASRTIDVHAFKETPGSQNLGLYSLPPTKHDAELEDSLLAFASQSLGCTTDQVARNSNVQEAAEMHNWNVRRIEGLFTQAAELKGPG